MIAHKHLGAIRFYNGERALQSKIAGLIWSPSYSIGNAFYEARDALPLRVRKAAFNRYVEDPYDGAAPSAIVDALARLKRGELLVSRIDPPAAVDHEQYQDRRQSPEGRARAGLGAQPQDRHRPGAGRIAGRL